MELDPLYCDVIIMRWQDFTGEDARLEDGRPFDHVQSERLVMAGETSEGGEEKAQEEGLA